MRTCLGALNGMICRHQYIHVKSSLPATVNIPCRTVLDIFYLTTFIAESIRAAMLMIFTVV